MNASSHKGFLLDTNIVIALFGASEDLKWQLAYDVQYFLPCVVVGELIYGAYKSSEVRQNLREIEAFIGSTTVVGCDGETGHRFGRIKADLRSNGKLIPDNDIWIAAIALQNEFTLITKDRHFSCVPGLSFETW